MVSQKKLEIIVEQILTFMSWEVRSTGSNNLENIWYRELWVNTKQVLGHPWATQIVEVEKINIFKKIIYFDRFPLILVPVFVCALNQRGVVTTHCIGYFYNVKGNIGDGIGNIRFCLTAPKYDRSRRGFHLISCPLQLSLHGAKGYLRILQISLWANGQEMCVLFYIFSLTICDNLCLLYWTELNLIHWSVSQNFNIPCKKIS